VPIRGRVYIGRDQLVQIATDHFRKILGQSMVYCERYLSTMSKEASYSLNEFLSVLRDPSSSRDYNNVKVDQSEINLQNLDQVASTSFPPCMRRLYNEVK
jgi:DNA primase large subunit